MILCDAYFYSLHAIYHCCTKGSLQERFLGSEGINIITFNKTAPNGAFLYSFYSSESLNIALIERILKSEEFSYIANTAELWTNARTE
jgi:hypothetical protein